MEKWRDQQKLQAAFGHALRSFRAEAGVSQEQLASKAGIHRNYVGNIERGEKNVCLKSMWNLAHALKISPTSLIQEVERQLKTSSK